MRQLLSFLVSYLLFITVLQAQPIRYVKPAPSGIGDGSSWANASGNLQAMIDALGSPGSQVWVAAGTYKPTTTDDRSISFSMKNNVAIYGGFAGTETSVSQRNWNTNVTILSGDLQNNDVITGSGSSLTISGNTENSYHVVYNDNIDITAVLDGFTITGGNANGDIVNSDIGGGMLNYGASPTLANCRFIRNRANYDGGGMTNYDDSSPALNNCSFIENKAFFGGGMQNTGSSPSLTNCSFSKNIAIVDGGGMENYDLSSPDLTNCSFSENNAVYGGGISNYISSTPTLINCSFFKNIAEEDGGGMANYQTSSPTLINCSFSQNIAEEEGGGMYNDASSPTLTNCILWGNTTTGIFNLSGSPIITSSIVQDINPAGSNPLFVNAATGDLRLSAGSPAIDAGNNAANSTTTDLDGNFRIIGVSIDLGAYEFQSQILPVNFLTFLTKKSDKAVELLWSTSWEQNADGFQIQHSTNGTDWKSIGWVAAAGNSTTEQKYRYLHTAPVLGSNFYRLLQRDLDGKTAYSIVRKENFDKLPSSITLLENPVRNGTATLLVSEPAVIQLYNAEGKLLESKRLQPGKQNWDMSRYASGAYFLRTENSTIRLVVL
jgi:hypothetical protein